MNSRRLSENHQQYFPVGYRWTIFSDFRIRICEDQRKWINKKGWTFEINFGVGRYLTNDSQEDSTPGREVTSFRTEASIKGGFSIGKRF